MDLLDVPKFVINLDSRSDRMSVFDNEFKSFFGQGQTYTRVPGVCCDPVSRAISTSHKSAIQMAKDCGFDCACIMEDDVMFVSGLSFGYAQSYFRNVPPNWGMLLGGTYSDAVADHSTNWVRLLDFSGMHFYVISSSAYDTVLGMDSDDHIDRWVARKSGLDVYRTRRLFAMQHPGYSDNRKGMVSYNGLFDRRDLI